MSTTKYIPVPRTVASWRNPNTDVWIDVSIKSIQVRRNKATITHESFKEELSVHLNELDYPLNPSVNVRFKYFDKMLDMALNKKMPALVVVGKGGIGKSFQTKSRIDANELEPDEDYKFIKGYSTAKALYNTLHKYADKILVFDDCDSILKESNSLNLLKAVLDSNTERKVSWLSSKTSSDVPATFDFTGSVIFLSNWGKEDFDQTILSRSVMIDLHMTEDELLDRMGKIMDYLDVGKTLTKKEKRVVLNMLRKYKHTVFDLNLRTLRKALAVYEESKDAELVRYQILNG